MYKPSKGLLLVAGAMLVCAPARGAVFSTPGEFSVSPTGAAIYTIPIEAPPGIAGMAPKLALTYNSQVGNGLLGVGWSLSGLSAITRCPRTVAQDGVRGGVNYNSNDRFCMDGQRLVLVAGSYGADGAEYRTERESFAKLVSYGTAGNGPAWFKVWTKSGQIMEYGNTPDSQVLAQGKATVRVWAVDKVSDTKGNYFTVTYVDDNANGQYYPSRIDYTGNASSNAALAPNNSVQFVYATRPDVTPIYQGGSAVKNTVRLTGVQTFVGASASLVKILEPVGTSPVAPTVVLPKLIRTYHLAYDNSGAVGRSRLIGVQECGSDGSCLPTTTFGWRASGTGSYTVTGYVSNADTCLQDCGTWQAGDVNGDGKTDLIHITINAGQMITWLSNGDGNYTPVSYISSGDRCMQTCGAWQPGDVNGDGKTDLIHITRNPGQMITWLSNGDGSYTPVSYIASADLCLQDCGTWQAGDINGDGKTDLIHITNAAGLVISWQPTYPADSIQVIANGLGVATSLSYKPLTVSSVYTKDSGSYAAVYPNVDLQLPLSVVFSVSLSDGIGGKATVRYRYGGAKAHYKGRGFLGFRWIEATDAAGTKTRTEYNQSFPYIGLPKKVTKTASTGALVNQVDSVYSFNDLVGNNPACPAAVSDPSPLPTSTSGKRYFVYVCRNLEQSWELNGAALPFVTTTNSFDACGNATQIVVQSSDGYTKSTVNTYLNDTTNWILGRLTRAQVTSTSP